MSMMVNPYVFGVAAHVDDFEVIAHMAAPVSNMFDFQGLTLTGYQRIVIMIDDLVVSANNTNLDLQFYISGSLISAGYRYNNSAIFSDGSADASADSNSASLIRLNSALSNNAGHSSNWRIDITNMGLYKIAVFDGDRTNASPALARNWGAGLLEDTGIIDGIKIYTASGNPTAGQVTIYGIALA